MRPAARPTDSRHAAEVTAPVVEEAAAPARAATRSTEGRLPARTPRARHTTAPVHRATPVTDGDLPDPSDQGDVPGTGPAEPAGTVEASLVVGAEVVGAEVVAAETAPEADDAPIALDEAPPGIDLVKAYLREIGKVALLNAEDEVVLAKRVEAGLFAAEKVRQADAREIKRHTPTYRRDLITLAEDGERAKRHLLEANLRLVVSLAKRYQGRGLDLLDLVQEGNLGLVRAVEKFDYAKGYKFSTYATWWIRQALQRALADQGRTIRVPVHMAELITKCTRTRRDLTQTLGREPSSEEIGQPLGMTPDKVEEILRYGRDTLSLQAQVGDDDAVLGDFITDTDSVDPASAVEMQMLQGQLREVLEALPERSAVVMRMRFGLEDGRARTLDEVGRHLGLTRERIRQIERDTLAELRHDRRAESLREFVA